MSLVARHLEANGIPTVVLGCARDIVEQCGVARFVFSDFPLGNPIGRPFDWEMQRQIMDLGFRLLESAIAPRTTVQSPFVWAEDENWKQDFDRVDTVERNVAAARPVSNTREERSHNVDGGPNGGRLSPSSAR